MKNLASLTNFFVTFLLVVYLGVFTGLKVNGFISGKKLVSVNPTPTSSSASQPSPASSVLAQAPQTQVQATTTQSRSTSSPTAVPAPAKSDLVPAATSPPLSVQTLPPVADVTAPSPPVDTSPPPAPPPPSEPPPSNRCIITISGGQYDVTEYRNIHSGGDVFQCGTDMTAAFLSQHPASFLQKMSQYKV